MDELAICLVAAIAILNIFYYVFIIRGKRISNRPTYEGKHTWKIKYGDDWVMVEHYIDDSIHSSTVNHFSALDDVKITRDSTSVTFTVNEILKVENPRSEFNEIIRPMPEPEREGPRERRAKARQTQIEDFNHILEDVMGSLEHSEFGNLIKSSMDMVANKNESRDHPNE